MYTTDLLTFYEIKAEEFLTKKRRRFFARNMYSNFFYLPVTENEPVFSVSTSPNSTEIMKLVLNNNTSNVYLLLFMTSKVWKKRKNFKINRKGGRFSKNHKKAEDLPLYRKTWQVCVQHFI